jgi:phage shock protein A
MPGPDGLANRRRYMSKRSEYIEKMKLQLDELNRKLDELEAKKNAASAEAGKKFDEQMAELRMLSGKARVKLNEIREASEDRWESLVAEGEKVQKAFVHSFNYFKSQLKG